MGILNRWRQFGRRYFWPHLLLGMVAASLGLPTSNLNESKAAATPDTTASISRQNPATFSLTELASLKDAHRRASFGIDYWHQHAIRTVIRHLSFALTVPQPHALPQTETVLSAHPRVILDTLNALLTSPDNPPVLSLLAHPHLAQGFTAEPHHSGLWLSQVRGIRAGPALAA